MAGRFDWDEPKDAENRRKHGVAFASAREGFLDRARVIARDLAHSTFHLSARSDQDLWRRLLATRQTNL